VILGELKVSGYVLIKIRIVKIDIAKSNVAKSKIISLVILLLLVVISSCSKFQRAMKIEDPKERYKAAVVYYEKKDYYRAGLLFEGLLPQLVGTPEAEKAQFYYAQCHFYQEQYLLSSYYFKSFNTTYGRSENAERASYMYAYSLYKNIPDYNLDQSSTAEAIDAMQNFINRYPNTALIDDANQVIKELQHNLEKKSYEVAKQYQRLRYYKAACTAYRTFQNDFPDSDYREEISFLLLESQVLLAKNSVPSLKQERWETALKNYVDFIDIYPQSKYLKQAQNYYDVIQDGIAAEKAKPQ
jgi:outer membrane protein assembly factor BamD